MRQKDPIELQRQRISLVLRAQASILRAEYLNQVLPAALEAFDLRLQQGLEVEVQPVDIKGLIEAAVEQVSAEPVTV